MIRYKLTKTHKVSAQDYKTDERINKDLNKWKDMPCSWIKKTTIKMSIVPKLIYVLIVIPINQNQFMYTFMWKGQETRIAKTIWGEKVMIEVLHDRILKFTVIKIT